MSIFKFSYTENSDSQNSVYFINEAKRVTTPDLATRFFAKKRNEFGFKEFFGVINNVKYIFDVEYHPNPNQQFLDEDNINLYTQYGLNEPLKIDVGTKEIPLFVPKYYLSIAPHKFANKERTQDSLAREAADRRKDIYDFYTTNLHKKHVESLSEVKCTSVADLYSYLNDGKEWKIGMEYYGYVDGLWETGSHLTVSIDTGNWNIHTSVHELGHSVSYFLIDEMFYEWYQIAIDKNEEPPSDYGHTEVSEDFAETYAFYFSSKQDNSMLKNMCPKRYKYMKKLVDLRDKALLPKMEASKALSKRFKVYDKVVYK